MLSADMLSPSVLLQGLIFPLKLHMKLSSFLSFFFFLGGGVRGLGGGIRVSFSCISWHSVWKSSSFSLFFKISLTKNSVSFSIPFSLPLKRTASIIMAANLRLQLTAAILNLIFELLLTRLKSCQVVPYCIWKHYSRISYLSPLRHFEI